MRICAVLCVRDEAAFLLDWLAHHRACGFTDFVVASNDCRDGTDTLLDRLAARGLLTHLRNDGPHGDKGIQFTALGLADRSEAVQNADWLLSLDIDEFVNIHVGDRTVPALLAALPQADVIPLTWRLFGNGGVVHYEDRPLPDQFPHAAPRVMLWPWRAAMFKTLYRRGLFGKLGVHRPRAPRPGAAQARWVDSSGRPAEDIRDSARVFSTYGRDNYQLAQLNHYPLGAMESYVLKADRGRAVHSDHMLDLDYWAERNFCTEEDRSIAALAPRVAAEKAQLLDDPQTAALHAQAVQWRKDRFTALMAQEEMRALFGRLLMTPPSRPLPDAAARFLLGHAQKALRG